MLNKKICIGFNDLKSQDLDKKLFDKIFKISLENNVNTFDIADNYYSGKLLDFFGNFIKKNQREKLCIINKFPLLRSKKELEANLDRSLKLLNTEYIDVYMPHWPSFYFDAEKLADFAIKQIKKGKIKKFGLSNFNLNLIKKFDKFYRNEISIQTEININNYSHTKKLIDYCKIKNFDIFAYSINNNFPKNNVKLNEFKKKFKISNYETSLIWFKQFKHVIPIIRSFKKKNILKNFNIINKQMKFKNISSINLKNFREIKISEVKKISSEGRKVYNSLEEALKNKLNLYPGPKLISQEIVKLGLAKPFI